LVLGGDGTFLRAAEAVRGRGIPLVGINVGHMGFLAEADADDLPWVIAKTTAGDYRVEERATVHGRVISADDAVSSDWALNEVTIQKTIPRRMIEVAVSVDGRPLSTFGCDGIVLATPTGSTGHAYSGGGPVVWPEVEALLMVPLSAHALFARPLVVSPSTVIAIELLGSSRSLGEVSFDGRRVLPIGAGGRLEVRHSPEPVALVRFGDAPFADRLVSKFSLPVKGWRR
jgi:NAD+ kinase